jgi:hypothetical protein
LEAEAEAADPCVDFDSGSYEAAAEPARRRARAAEHREL